MDRSKNGAFQTEEECGAAALDSMGKLMCFLALTRDNPVLAVIQNKIMNLKMSITSLLLIFCVVK